MSEPGSDPRLLRPGPVRRVTVTGFDRSDVLVVLGASSKGSNEAGRISREEASMRRIDHPSEVFEIGQELDAEEVGRWRGEVHLSARACENPELRTFLLALQRGKIVSGTVSEVHNFGVFVHLDGEPDGLCTGFIRVPELTWSWISHPSEVVEAGQRITAEVLIAETRQGQVAISMKALQRDPLIEFSDRSGQVLRSTVTKIVPFGAFVRVAPDVEGLLHLSEMTSRPAATPDQFVREGDQITVRVAEVDVQRRRVRLCAAAGQANGDSQ